MAWATPAIHKEVWGTTQQAEPIQEEVNHFLSYCNNPRMDLNVEVATLSVKTSKASWLTSLWSASSEQYLQPPQEEGHSSSALSKVLKWRQSPSPFGCLQDSCTSNQGHRDFLKARQPPGQHCQSPAQEENLLLQEEIQRLCEYRCQDQMRINFLQRQLATKRQLGHTKGLVQATQIQPHGPPADCEYGQGHPSGCDYDDDYVCDLHHMTDNSCQTFHDFHCRHSSSGAGPCGAAPPCHCHDHTLQGHHPQPPHEVGSESHPAKHVRHCHCPTNWS
jgi:hypothetical protein